MKWLLIYMAIGLILAEIAMNVSKEEMGPITRGAYVVTLILWPVVLLFVLIGFLVRGIRDREGYRD